MQPDLTMAEQISFDIKQQSPTHSLTQGVKGKTFRLKRSKKIV
jgi:hypothetical protein